MATQYILGRHLFSCNVYPGTRAESDGAITWGTAISILPYLEALTFDDIRDTERIVPVTAVQAHYERTVLDSTCQITEILRKGGTAATGTPAVPTTGQILPILLQGFDIIKIVAVRGKQAGVSTTVNCGTYTYIGQIARGSDGHQNAGKNTATISLMPFFDGTNAPFTYAEAATS